jgi:hypothetical protein
VTKDLLFGNGFASSGHICKLGFNYLEIVGYLLLIFLLKWRWPESTERGEVGPNSKGQVGLPSFSGDRSRSLQEPAALI